MNAIDTAVDISAWQRQGKHRRGIRYPAPFRDAVVTVAPTHVGHGRSLAQMARDVGVSLPTLAAWLERPGRPRLRAVAVAAELDPPTARRAPVVLITPQGVRVEGLDGTALVAVLRALS